MYREELLNHLKEFVTNERWALFNKVIQYRTNYLTVVLEDIYQAHNASAVIRSCDCFGVQDVHIIENKNTYQLSREVSVGADKWLNLNYYRENSDNTTVDTFNTLRNNGYRIVATTPHTNDVNLEEFDLTKGKTALVFGTELKGLSKTALDNADEFLKIPMYGFTESYNISVSASIILHQLSLKLHESTLNWKLNKKEKTEILITWLKKSIKDGERISGNFLKNNPL